MSLTPMPESSSTRLLSDEEILEIVLQEMRTTNAARPATSLLTIAPDAPLFGPGSPLDSLGLLTLLLDIEEELQRAGCHVQLSDDRAMSQRRSPFRSVSSLVDYIARITRD